MPKKTKTKTWKSGGIEDKILDEMVKEGTLTTSTKPSTLKLMNLSVFGNFSDNVIRNHLNDAKRKHGVYLIDDGDEANDADDGNVRYTGVADVSVKAEQSSDVPSYSTAVYQNFPYICEMYKNPETRLDVVLVMVDLPGGAQNISPELNTEGTVVTVKYNWPKSMYNVNDLFKKFIAAGEFSIIHPKVLAVGNALEKCCASIDSAPEGAIVITLPMKVQTGLNTWSKFGIARNDGMQVVMMEFMGYVKDYHKAKQNVTIVFNK